MPYEQENQIKQNIASPSSHHAFSLQSKSHQRLPHNRPVELAGPGSRLGYPAGPSDIPGTVASNFLLPPPGNDASHRFPADRLSLPQENRSRSFNNPAAAESDQEDVDDPSFVPPSWTEPPSGSDRRKSASNRALNSGGPPSTAATGGVATTTGQMSALKVRMDILQIPPADKRQQPIRTSEDPRYVEIVDEIH
jgi:hypothetical protein